MDNLAVELLDCIFSLACSDGGQTACALRETSKLYCAVAQRHRFRSVAILCCSKARKFWQAFQEAPLEERSSIHHLFVSIQCSCGMDCSSAVRSIHKAASPTLHTLSCLLSNKDNIVHDAIDLIHFPRLRHLTINLPVLASPEPVAVSSSHTSSAELERIHDYERRALCGAFPNLTEVRFDLSHLPTGTFSAAITQVSKFMRSTSSRLSSIHLLGVALNTDIASVTQRMLEDPSAAGIDKNSEDARRFLVGTACQQHQREEDDTRVAALQTKEGCERVEGRVA